MAEKVEAVAMVTLTRREEREMISGTDRRGGCGRLTKCKTDKN